MSLPLTAPSSVRRSKKRCAQYVETHEQLRREVEIALMRQSDGLGAWLADALEAEMGCFDAEAAA